MSKKEENEKEARIGIEALKEALHWSKDYPNHFEQVMKPPIDLEKGLNLLNCARALASYSAIYYLALLPKAHRVDILNKILTDMKTFILENSEVLFKE